jgi:hypothetical protein
VSTLRAAVIAAALALPLAFPLVAAPSDRFAVGVLRRDGIIIPFGVLDGRTWNSDWPKPARHISEVPVTIRSVPKWWWGRPGPRDTWQATMIGSPNRVELHVTGANVFDAQCLQQIGLRTDYRPAVRPPGLDARPYPKDGLAVSPSYPVEPIEVMPIPSVVPRPVVDAFNKANLKAIFAAEGPAGVRSMPPLPPITVEAMYASGHDVSRLYYIEALAQYKLSGDPPLCESLTYGAGWFNVDGRGQLRPLSFELARTSCDRAGLLYMLPLGVVRSGGRVFWIAQWSGWNVEEYRAVEINPDGTRDAFRVSGGGCE